MAGCLAGKYLVSTLDEGTNRQALVELQKRQEQVEK